MKIPGFTIGTLILLLCFSCGKSNIYHNISYNEITQIAWNEQKPFCIVVVNDSSQQVLSKYLSTSKNHHIDKKAIINVITTYNHPESNWYKQWLCSGNAITSCLFSPNGKLQAVIEGNSIYSLKFIDDILKGDTSNIDFGYRPLFEDDLDKVDKINFLNKVLECKVLGEQNQDVEVDLDSTLRVTRYPYNVYLKLLTEKAKNDQESVTRWANELLNLDNRVYYNKLYPDLFEYAIREVDPNYALSDFPVLSINKNEVKLAVNRLHEPIPFHIIVSNIGKGDLVIKAIETSCQCVKILSSNIPVIKSGKSYEILFQFIPDTEKERIQKVNILSNAKNKIETITIRANGIEDRKDI